MTPTTEQLKALAESLGLNFFIEQRAGVWVKEWFNNGCTSATAEEVMMWSMLANREAQPVIVVGDDGGDALAYRRLIQSFAPGTKLYTAPPAPANAVAWEMRYWNSGHNMWHDWERITAGQHAEMSAEHATSNDYEFRVLYDAPPAPAVPEISHSSVVAEQLAHVLSNMEVTDHQRAIISCAVDRLNKTAEVLQQKPTAIASPGDLDYQGAKELFNYLMTEEEINATVNGWNACRSAMLAQPVSSGYKLEGGENCWSCGKHFTYVQHSDCDGYCPHCNAPVDLDDDEDQLSQVVPVEPTGDMVAKAWREALGKCDHETIKRMYRTMLAAAPEGGN